MNLPIEILMNDPEHALAVFTIGMTVGAWLVKWRREQRARRRFEDKMKSTAKVVASLAHRLSALDGVRVPTREQPAYKEIEEDSQG